MRIFIMVIFFTALSLLCVYLSNSFTFNLRNLLKQKNHQKNQIIGKNALSKGLHHDYQIDRESKQKIPVILINRIGRA